MMKALKKKRREKQIMLVAAMVALSGAAFLALYYTLFKVRGAVAEIYCKARLVRRIDLMSAQEEKFSIPELPNVAFRVTGDGSIAFERSDCSDQLCVQAGRLSRRGQIAACLPNDVYIRIVSPSEIGSEETELVLDEEAGPLDDAGYSYET